MGEINSVHCSNGCGCGMTREGGNNNCLFLILILLFCGGGCGSTFGGSNNSCLWIILILLFCGGCGSTFSNDCDNGCGCGSTFGVGCGC